MKKLLLAVIVVTVALTLCAPAFAGSAPTKFTCVGKIKAVDPTAGSVTVRVTLASRGVADYLGKDLTIAVASDAKIYKARGRVLVPITLGDLLIGEKLRVSGAIDSSGEAAAFVGQRLVMRHVAAWHVTHFSFRGPVTAVDADAGTLTARLNRVSSVLRRAYHRRLAFDGRGQRPHLGHGGRPAGPRDLGRRRGRRPGHRPGYLAAPGRVEVRLQDPLDDRQACRRAGARDSLTDT